jgi:hypothetical protein
MSINILPMPQRFAAQLRPASQPAPASADRHEGASTCLLFTVVAASGLAALIAWLSLHLLIMEAPLAGPGPIFSVEAVRTGLVRDPAVWLHRSLRIRAIASRCGGPAGGPHCLYAQPQLLGASGDGATWALSLDWDPASPPLLQLVRRLPVLGTLMPPPQRLRWGVMAVYRVRLAPVSPPPWGASPCYEGVLLDAAPGPL